MASFKYEDKLHRSFGLIYDQELNPGMAAPLPGIYRCVSCGDEIAIAGGHTLPSQNHRQHGLLQMPIRWQLVVSAVQQ